MAQIDDNEWRWQTKVPVYKYVKYGILLFNCLGFYYLGFYYFGNFLMYFEFATSFSRYAVSHRNTHNLAKLSFCFDFISFIYRGQLWNNMRLKVGIR